MSNIVSFTDMSQMAEAIAKSGLFGMKDTNSVLALMAVAQAEGMHPATAARDFHIIQGRPALKADAMLARFQNAAVKWTGRTTQMRKLQAYLVTPTEVSLPLHGQLNRHPRSGLLNQVRAGKSSQEQCSDPGAFRKVYDQCFLEVFKGSIPLKK